MALGSLQCRQRRWTGRCRAVKLPVLSHSRSASVISWASVPCRRAPAVGNQMLHNVGMDGGGGLHLPLHLAAARTHSLLMTAQHPKNANLCRSKDARSRHPRTSICGVDNDHQPCCPHAGLSLSFYFGSVQTQPYYLFPRFLILWRPKGPGWCGVVMPPLHSKM